MLNRAHPAAQRPAWVRRLQSSSMQWEFVCPKCRTSFTAEGPDSVKAVPCPTCAILLPVPAQARQSPVYLAPSPTREKHEVNWILWIVAGFAALWVIVIVTM